MAVSVSESGIPSSLLDAMNPKKSTTSKSAVEETQDRFMKLLVTQMRNQDPMNPLDNAQVTSQFAQLSTVTGIDKLNDTLASLMGTYQVSQSLQAANMIGHGVLVPGSKMALVKGGAIMGVELPKAAEKVDITIRDASGIEVRTINLGAQEAGSLPLTWDGKKNDGTAAPDGNYTFEVTATQKDEKVAATALQFGLVGTVATGPNSKGVTLNLEGIGKVDFADVRQIL
ncbi:MAG TPA: flagellar hook assembly protein FlgD [Noviherbaspirillum sp.]|nr:flagellar hook assembly protein FlgD [Noviherbaspirillum sp.]